LGIIDFTHVPNRSDASKSFAGKPYFEDFMGAIQRQTQPGMLDPPMWLNIYRTKEAKVRVSHYVHSGMFRDTYDLHYSNY
jgi:hypothetical protein